jgi:hypothetical protein
MSIENHDPLGDYERRIAPLWPSDKLPLVSGGRRRAVPKPAGRRAVIC